MYHLFFAFIGITFIIYIFIKVKSGLLPEGKSLFWLAGGFAMLFLSIFPKTIDFLSTFFGIYHPPSLLFLLTCVFLIFRIFRQEQDIALLNERMKELAQQNALLDEKLRRPDTP
jgi:hypothetical protein